MPQECQLVWHFREFRPVWSIDFSSIEVVNGARSFQRGRSVEKRGFRVQGSVSGSVPHDRSVDCETVMAHHLAKLPEPVSTDDASREEAIIAGLKMATDML